MNPSNATELDVPTIMRIGAARMTAGLDRMARIDLAAHGEIFGPLPRMSAEELIDAAARWTCAVRAAPRSRSRASSRRSSTRYARAASRRSSS